MNLQIHCLLYMNEVHPRIQYPLNLNINNIDNVYKSILHNDIRY